MSGRIGPRQPRSGKRSAPPRRYDDDVERALILRAGYATLREYGTEVSITHVLAAAGMSTRSFYRHFSSKDALLCAMYRRNAEAAAERLTRRVARSTSPSAAVVDWIDDVFALVIQERTAERAAVMRSIVLNHADGAEAEVTRARGLLKAPLEEAIIAGVASGAFTASDPALAAELISVAVLHASGLLPTSDGEPADCASVTELCLRALGA